MHECLNGHETFGRLDRELQDKLVDQFERLINAEAKVLSQGTDERGKTVYKPSFDRFDIVLVSFIGVGHLMNQPHYAVVWDAPAHSSNLSVFPLSSKVKHRKYGIGPIDTLPAEDTAIMINQLTSVSRRSIIEPVKKRTPAGRLVNVSLTVKQQRQVLALFHETLLKQPTLRSVIEKELGNHIPFGLSEDNRSDLDVPVSYGLHQSLLLYQLPWSKTMKAIPIQALEMPFGERRKLVRDLLSRDPLHQAEAERAIALKEAGQTAAEAAISRIS
ncbi:type II toxin-antitoxin system PemK/MazF family toxin [Paenibacillus albicereus]|uniref:Type II toxin-antitoxin system PemK/MazF family toxin n=1 Tax=Paenibacillus albicereus TaxID=2726185 RepID=A0A6H2GSR2_9BACL|nr:type II toxin-antitoxin system PemK/MazF family toxin [Paenibacillus albicereus]QJC50216.1 type II toxin-antitoxin system PemK/MazF family toxin [Paenibacillus albicereus]